MASSPHVLFFHAQDRPCDAVAARLADRGLSSATMSLGSNIRDDYVRRADLAVVALGAQPAREGLPLGDLLTRLSKAGIATLIWGGPNQLPLSHANLAQPIPPDASLDEIVGSLTTLAHFAPLLKRMDRELAHLQRLGEQLNRYFGEIDQEMRLAGRLQRDFLPRQMPQPDGLCCACLFRPASWVSGDIYDVFQIDEHHLGVFVADAMGHGTAAALMTMFLRSALVARELDSGGYRIVPPGEAMASLNETLVRQALPDCHFITAAYGVIDIRTRELRLARGGHPYPLLVRDSGDVEELRAEGGLLGLAELDGEFGEATVKLKLGDKLVFYTDGLEDDFIAGRDDHSNTLFTPHLLEWLKCDVHTLTRTAGEYLNQQEGSLNPADDATIVALQVVPTVGATASPPRPVPAS